MDTFLRNELFLLMLLRLQSDAVNCTICVQFRIQRYTRNLYLPAFNIISSQIRYASAVQDGSQYFVLLIITDGVISDMAQTKEAIVNVSSSQGEWSSLISALSNNRHILICAWWEKMASVQQHSILVS